MLFRNRMSITQQLMHIYNTTVHKNKFNENVALNLMRLGVHENTNKGRKQPFKIISQIIYQIGTICNESFK